MLTRALRRAIEEDKADMEFGQSFLATVASSAPAERASKTRPALPSTVAVTTTMGQGDSRMMRRVASTPSITGMIMSIRIRSGRSALHCSMACCPPVAIHARNRKRATK